MANADATYGADSDRTVRTPSNTDLSRNRDLKALNDKIDRLILGQQKQYGVNMVDEDESDQTEEVSYMQSNGNFRGQQQQFTPFWSHPNLSYRSQNVANPQDQSYPNQTQPYQPRPFIPRPQGNNNFRPYQTQAPQQQQAATPDVTALLNQILKEQTNHSSELSVIKADINRKIETAHTELSSKIEQLTSRIQYLEGHHDSTSTVKVTGQLPGKAVQNPREFNVSVIALCSENDTPKVIDKDIIAEDNNFTEEEADLDRDRAENGSELRRKRRKLHIKSALDSNTRQLRSREFASDTMEVSKPVLVAQKTSPFLDKISCLDKYKNPFQHYPQDILEPLDYVCNALTKIGSPLLKCTDPGEITLTCMIGGHTFAGCLVDTGAGINTITLDACEKMGFVNFKPCGYTIRLADYTYTKPYGMLEDVLVDVGGVIVPTDFAVWDIPSESDSPILFGRPFLKSARATIDMTSGQVVINADRNKKLAFDPHSYNIFQDAPEEPVRTGPHLSFLLEPSELNNGVVEYTVRGGRHPLPHEKFNSNIPGTENCLGPFSVGRQTHLGTLAMLGTTRQQLPFNGQKVQLHIVESRRTQQPPRQHYF